MFPIIFSVYHIKILVMWISAGRLFIESARMLELRCSTRIKPIQMKLKAVFLDRDGALIPDTPLDKNEKIQLNERFIEGLQLLQSYGYLLVIVSNAAGINNHGIASEHLEDFKKNIIKSCSKMGIYLDGFYYGPHNSGNNQPGERITDAAGGIIHKAAGDMDIDLSASWMIGDIVSDVQAGKQAGCKAVLVQNGKPVQQNGIVAAKDLADAARKIVRESGLEVKRRNGRWRLQVVRS